jgi:hypothetical protein
MRPVETIPGMGEGDKEEWWRRNSNMIYFTYCMNFCKCHMYPQHNNKKYQ